MSWVDQFEGAATSRSCCWGTGGSRSHPGIFPEAKQVAGPLKWIIWAEPHIWGKVPKKKNVDFWALFSSHIFSLSPKMSFKSVLFLRFTKVDQLAWIGGGGWRGYLGNTEKKTYFFLGPFPDAKIVNIFTTLPLLLIITRCTSALEAGEGMRRKGGSFQGICSNCYIFFLNCYFHSLLILASSL